MIDTREYYPIIIFIFSIYIYGAYPAKESIQKTSKEIYL